MPSLIGITVVGELGRRRPDPAEPGLLVGGVQFPHF